MKSHAMFPATATDLATLLVLLGGCEPHIVTPEIETVLLRIEGTVSATGGAPVAGASVTLGAGGHFTFPVTLLTVTTDADGAYLIERATSVLKNDCPGTQLWVEATAPGYEPQGGLYSPLRPACSPALQRIDITLNP